MASLISQRSLAPFPSLFLFFSALIFASEGRDLYLKNCSLCHHEERIGRTGPPLLPQTLKGKSTSQLMKVIKEGIPGTTMPPFNNLSREEVFKIIEFLKRPASRVIFSMKDIKKSREFYPKVKTHQKPSDPLNTVVLIDRGKREVVILEGSRILGSFQARSVHGGVKFTADLRRFYVPSREGWIYLYSLKEGIPLLRVRPCVYMRNIDLRDDGEYVGALCVLPPSLVILSGDLEPLKVIQLKGRPSGLYYLRTQKKFLIAFRDRSVIGFASKQGNYFEEKISSPLMTFTVEPLEKYLIGGTADRRRMVVYDLETLREVYSVPVASLPHLFAGTYWYRKGNFYFATRHSGSGEVSIWRLYRWKLVASVATDGRGFFVRTSPLTPYLWVDSGSSSYTLIDKETFKVKKIKVAGEGRATHVEFSADGSLAYLSVIGIGHGLYLIDPVTLEKKGRIKALSPAGKYSPLFKTPILRASLLGREIYMEKCWGCHNLRRKAFGPSFESIARRLPPEAILKRIQHPPSDRMPSFELSDQEKSALLALFRFLKGRSSYAQDK